MRAKDMHPGLPVFVGRDKRPAWVVHEEDGRWWVSFTDRKQPGSQSVRPRDVVKR
jgi:hypothetical protein